VLPSLDGFFLHLHTLSLYLRNLLNDGNVFSEMTKIGTKEIQNRRQRSVLVNLEVYTVEKYVHCCGQVQEQ